MPSAVRPCRQFGCPGVTKSRSGYCVEHEPQHKAKQAARLRARRGSTTERGYGHRWRKLRAKKLAMNPLCEKCSTVAVLVDHITPILDGGDRFKLANLQSLCRECHDIKTHDDIRKRTEAGVGSITTAR